MYREIIADEEQMADVRATITPEYAQQLTIFAQSATGNNKLLLQELSDAVSQPTTGSATPSTSVSSALIPLQVHIPLQFEALCH